MEYQEYILEGNPGAGKSTLLTRLVSEFQGDVIVAAPFRIVKDFLKSQQRPGADPLYDIWQSKNIPDAEFATRLLREAVENVRNRTASLSGSGQAIIFFDRGWITLLRALEDMGVTSDTLEKEKEFWRRSSRPDTFFLTTAPAVSLEANRERGLQADWRSSAAILTDDHKRRAALVASHPHRIIQTFSVDHLEQDRGFIFDAIRGHILTQSR